MKQTAFITGAGGSIGSETARRLARDGYAIAIAAAAIAAAAAHASGAEIASSAEPAQRFRLYPQTLEARFASAADAEAAALSFRELPPGMAMSLSARGDDSSYRHLQHGRALSAAGAKSTYYVNGVSPDFVEKTLRPVLALGHSVGAHTQSHPYLSSLAANGIFDEILGNRIAIESAADTCVSTFTLPFCNRDGKGNPGARPAIGESLRRAGILGGGDVLEDPVAAYGLPPDSFVGCLRYGFDDRNPSRDLFEKGVGKAEARILANDLPPCGPHVVMGMHSWADDAGMAELTPCFELRTKNPDAPFAGRTWVCNENEFVASWMQSRHARVAKTERSGDVVRWTLLRPDPAQLGADVPLFVAFGRAPAALRLDGAALPVAESGQAALPNAAARRLPVRIDHLPAPEDDADELAASAKFPGLRARLDADPAAGRAVLPLRNDGTAPLRALRATLRLPPAFAPDAVPDGESLPDTLAPGEAVAADFRLRRLHDDPWFTDGPALFDAELDFDLGDAAGRIHATRRIVAPRTPDPTSLRDCARVATALPAAEWTAERLAALSNPGATLDGLRLFPLDASPIYARCAFLFASALPEAKALSDAVPKAERKNHRHLLVAEFTAKGGEATIDTRGEGTLYVNGEERPFKNGTRVPTHVGLNRVILVISMDAWCKRGFLDFFEAGAVTPCPWSPVVP